MDDPQTKPLRRDEMSARTGFAGNRLWRDGEKRTTESLDEALAHPKAYAYLTTEDARWLCRSRAFSGKASAEAAFAIDAARDLGARPDAAVLLGTDPDGVPVLTMPLAGAAADFDGISDVDAVDLRSLAMQAVLDQDTEGRLGQAAHLLGWHRRNGFCARCGGRTVSEAAGYRRRCTACESVVFPRTDPVTIMLVHDGKGRCILGRQPHFPEKFWSCLAGFVEAGETIEDAVRRETLEEAGVHVGRVVYLASQPWPFPGSLMIGCHGIAEDFDIAFDGDELEACRWFTREEVKAMLKDRHPDGLAVPKGFAIAHHLIGAFAEGMV